MTSSNSRNSGSPPSNPSSGSSGASSSPSGSSGSSKSSSSASGAIFPHDAEFVGSFWRESSQPRVKYIAIVEVNGVALDFPLPEEFIAATNPDSRVVQSVTGSDDAWLIGSVSPSGKATIRASKHVESVTVLLSGISAFAKAEPFQRFAKGQYERNQQFWPSL